MLPQVNPHNQKPSKDQLQSNGIGASAPQQQVLVNPANFFPNPMQIRAQFPMGVLNPQFAQFANPNPYPFPQGNFQGISSNINHMFPRTPINPHQFLPNMQFNLSNFAQNVNQLLQIQMQNGGPQNFSNVQPVGMNGNGNLQHSMNNENVLKHANLNATASKDFSSMQQKDWHAFSSHAAKSQGNEVDFNGKNHWKRSNKKNFTGNLRGGSQKGFVKQQFRHRQNSKGNFKHERQERGYNNAGSNFPPPDSCIQVPKEKVRRSLSLNYTEQEIQKWRDERRKNYPSKANMDKKLKDSSLPCEITDAQARTRRRQLKEILEKQAELGCEVAEIPASYLSDTEQQTDVGRRNQKALGKRDRFQNKFDKRRKFHQNQDSGRHRPEDTSANCRDHKNNFAEKQKLTSDRTSAENRREPSLLQKLLRPDIERDKKHLLQAFRFMVMNSFFDDWPKKALEFPVVIVKESGDENATVEQRHHVQGEGVSTSSTSFIGSHHRSI